MKKNVIIFLLFASFSVFGQKVQEQSATMSLGPQNSYFVTVEGANKEILEDVWKKYTKEFGKTKQNKKAKEYVTEKAKVALIGGDVYTIYSRIEEGVGQATTTIWIDNGKGFVSSANNASSSQGAQTFLKDFWIMARKEAINKEMEKEEKKSKDLAKDLDKLKEKKKNNEEEIVKLKKKIIELEQDNVTNGKDQFKKQGEIDAQKAVIQAVVNKLNAVGKSM